MQLYLHDSQHPLYRSPSGAQPTDSLVQLRIGAPQDAAVTLRTWSEQGEGLYPMHQVGYAHGRYLFETALRLPTDPVVLWYSFLIEREESTLWYGNASDGLGGEGVLSHDLPDSYQITVYDKDYTTPTWMQDGAMYQIFVDRFCDGDAPRLQLRDDIYAHTAWDEQPLSYDSPPMGVAPRYDFFGGNLAGIMQKLPYLRDLGITALYLNPIFTAASNHKYDTSDYDTIDPTFGTNALFTALCAAARAMGIRIMLDGVFSHTGDDSVYFNKYGHYKALGAYQSPVSPYAGWYTFAQFPDKYKSWWGFSTLPEVNKDDPSYRKFLFEGKEAILTKWLDAGAAGWRLDVADELPDDFICALRKSVKASSPDAVVLGEVWEDASHKIAYGKLRNYALGHSLDSVMNYPLRAALLSFFKGESDSARFVRTIQSLRENYPTPMFYALMNLSGSHDRARTINELCGMTGEGLPREEWNQIRLNIWQYAHARAQLMAMFAVICALPGMPCIYYGDEAGMQGAGDPFNRATYPWGREDASLADFHRRTLSRRHKEALWRRGEMTLLSPHPDVLLILRHVDAGRDALGQDAENGQVMLAISRSKESIALFFEKHDARLSPFLKDDLRISLPPLTPCYFKA